MTGLTVLCAVLLALLFAAIREARRAMISRDAWHMRYLKYKEFTLESADRIDREIAALKDENEALGLENAALREQLRGRGVITESAFASAKRFHRARFDRGIDILRGVQSSSDEDICSETAAE